MHGLRLGQLLVFNRRTVVVELREVSRGSVPGAERGHELRGVSVGNLRCEHGRAKLRKLRGLCAWFVLGGWLERLRCLRCGHVPK